MNIGFCGLYFHKYDVDVKLTSWDSFEIHCNKCTFPAFSANKKIQNNKNIGSRTAYDTEYIMACVV